MAGGVLYPLLDFWKEKLQEKLDSHLILFPTQVWDPNWKLQKGMSVFLFKNL